MSSTPITTPTGIVTVTNVAPVTTYYRGRYYRTVRSVATTHTGFRMLTTDTFHYGIPSYLRWFSADPATVRHTSSRRYDWMNDTSKAPF